MYDANGRISSYTSPEDVVSFAYDDNGNIIRTRNSQGDITRAFDALNRVTSCTDTDGKTIGYEYDSVGNLVKLTYPDNTAVNYAYDENHNLVRVTDWANRVTTYTYDKNNRVTGIVKPNGTTVTTTYERNKVKTTVERTAAGAVITGFEYTYDNLSRVIEEKVLANSSKLCYTYDDLSRVTSRTIKNLADDSVIATETFSYDAAGNITGGSANTTFVYDINNRLTNFNGNAVSYDLDGNMLSNGTLTCTYDSANRLTSAGGHTYTYNAENVRIRNLCAEEDTTYTYNTNAKLSMLLMKTTNGVVTKYIYGRGLIGEESGNVFKTYHFDSRGSTIAITDASGTITDTFAYDTYGKQIARTGTSDVIFGYNGREGVVTDDNGLIYMRARYYSPDMKRFINADIVAGEISNAITLNRFAYANGNPVSFVDPFGLSVWSWLKDKYNDAKEWVADTYNNAKDTVVNTYNAAKDIVVDTYNEVKDWAVDTYNDVKERVVNTYNDTKDFVVDKYNDAKDWVDEKIVQPVATVVNNVKEDIQNYDKNNTDVEKVYKSHYFSSYKGTTIIRHSSDFLTSWGIGNMIFLNHNEDPPAGSSIGSNQTSTLNHEYGHTQQCDELGLGKYILFVAIPSMAYNLASRDNKTLNDNYYNMPWEYDADLRGGVTRNNVASWAPTIRDIYFDLIN